MKKNRIETDAAVLIMLSPREKRERERLRRNRRQERRNKK